MNTSEVAHIASLSKLHFSDTELETFAKEFTELVSYVEIINHLEIESVEPLEQIVSTDGLLREDIGRPSLTTKEALLNAPKKSDTFFKVPKVLE